MGLKRKMSKQQRIFSNVVSYERKECLCVIHCSLYEKRMCVECPILRWRPEWVKRKGIDWSLEVMEFFDFLVFSVSKKK